MITEIMYETVKYIIPNWVRELIRGSIACTYLNFTSTCQLRLIRHLVILKLVLVMNRDFWIETLY
jgi:hypothetical protein